MRLARLPADWIWRWLAAWLGLLLVACTGADSDLLLVGTVERTQVELLAPVSEILVALPVARAQHIERGTTVARLDPTLAVADLARAEAALAMARSALAVANQEHQRARELRRDRVVSQQQLDRAVLALDEATARTREAEARRQAATKHVEDHTLVSPVSGIVDQLPFEQGERVLAGAVIAVIAADGDPWVRVWIPERAVATLAPGTDATVRIDGVGELRGRVEEVAREPEYTPHFALTERERAYLVFEARVRILDAPPALRAGVPAEVTIPSAAAAPAPAPVPGGA